MVNNCRMSDDERDYINLAIELLNEAIDNQGWGSVHDALNLLAQNVTESDLPFAFLEGSKVTARFSDYGDASIWQERLGKGAVFLFGDAA